MKKNSKKGFTLAELLVVIAIIAVLVAISIPVFGNITGKAKFTADLATARANYAEALVNAMADDDYDGGKIDVDLDDISANIDNSDVATSTNGFKVSYPAGASTYDYNQEIAIDKDVNIT